MKLEIVGLRESSVGRAPRTDREEQTFQWGWLGKAGPGQAARLPGWVELRNKLECRNKMSFLYVLSTPPIEHWSGNQVRLGREVGHYK